MFRIGIIGSDNSHALEFSRIANIPDKATGEYLFPDCRVTCIFGLDKEQTENVAKEGKIALIVDRIEDLINMVDAIMVVFRHGDLHMEYAMRFIKAGVPTWIDKPFTIKAKDAKILIEAAKQNGTLLTGGSTCKYANDILVLKNAVESRSSIGAVKSGIINFPATLVNEYGGIYFYGAHLAEMTMEVFGYNPKSVLASEKNENVMAIVKYENYQVMMNFIPDLKEYYAMVVGENGTLLREIDISSVYRLGFERFIEMLRTKKQPFAPEQLYAPVELLNCVVKSYRTNSEVLFDSY